MQENIKPLTIDNITEIIINSINVIATDNHLTENLDYEFEQLPLDSMQWMMVVSEIEKKLNVFFPISIDPITLNTYSSTKKLAEFLQKRYTQYKK